MTGWNPERIPISLTPLPGEGLDSWLERYARRLRVRSDGFLALIGLTGSPLARMVTMLHSREREILTTATGVDPTALTAMTLQPFDTIAVTINPATRAVEQTLTWRRQAGSRYCPSCLHENDGAWQLRWRLVWFFACPTHACLLADTCPRCQRRIAAHRRGSQHGATLAGACTAAAPLTPRGGRAGPCAYPLTQVEVVNLPQQSLVMKAQHRIDALLSTAAASPRPDLPETPGRAQQILSELHVLAYKALAALHTSPDTTPEPVRVILSDCGHRIPARRQPLDSHDAHTIAVISSIAVAAHHPDATGQAVLAWIINAELHARMRPEPKRLLQSWKDADPQLSDRILTILDPHFTTRDRLAYTTIGDRPRPVRLSTDQIDSRISSLPAALWPTLSLPLLAANTHTNPAGVTAYRAVLSVMTLIPGTGLTYSRANTLLGSRATRNAHITIEHLPPQQLNTILTVLTDLASYLDEEPAPINYTRRRHLFGAEPAALIDLGAYSRFATAHGYRPLSPLQQRLLGDHLAVLLTGTRPTHPSPQQPKPGSSTTIRRRRDDIDIWNPLAFTLPTSVRAFIHDQGEQLLRRHTITEPLTWHPPLPATQDPWPGIDPTSIDSQDFAQTLALNAPHRNGLGRISKAIGLNSQQIQLYTQIVDQVMNEEQWNDLADTTHDVMDLAGLRHLYGDPDLSVTDIARLSLTSEGAVRNTLTDNGTAWLSHHRPRRAGLSPDWFQKNYLDTPRTLAQVAVITGYSIDTLRRRARAYGIPTQRREAPYNPFASWAPNQMPPPAVVAACSGPRGLQYVREIITLPGHPTYRSAAAPLNIAIRQLFNHRARIEHITGITLFEPQPGFIPTPAGADFIRHATKALHRLDQQNKRS